MNIPNTECMHMAEADKMTDLQKRLKRKFQRKPSSVASSDSDNLILSPMISGKQSPVILHTTKSYSKENFQRRETIDGGFLNNLDEGRPISTQVNVDKDTGTQASLFQKDIMNVNEKSVADSDTENDFGECSSSEDNTHIGGLGSDHVPFKAKTKTSNVKSVTGSSSRFEKGHLAQGASVFSFLGSESSHSSVDRDPFAALQRLNSSLPQDSRVLHTERRKSVGKNIRTPQQQMDRALQEKLKSKFVSKRSKHLTKEKPDEIAQTVPVVHLSQQKSHTGDTTDVNSGMGGGSLPPKVRSSPIVTKCPLSDSKTTDNSLSDTTSALLPSGDQRTGSALVSGMEDKQEDPMALLTRVARPVQGQERSADSFQGFIGADQLVSPSSVSPVVTEVSQGSTAGIRPTSRPGVMAPLHSSKGSSGQGASPTVPFVSEGNADMGMLMKLMGRETGGNQQAEMMRQLLNSSQGRVASSAATGGLMGSLGGAQVGMPSMMSNMGGGFGAQLGAGGQTQEEAINVENPDDNQVIHQMLAYEQMKARDSKARVADKAVSTIIIIDTSGSMAGTPIIEAGQFISEFLAGLEEIQFELQVEENVALIAVGRETYVAQHFTNDYSLIRRAADTLSAEGPSKLHIGLMLPMSLLPPGSPKFGVRQLSQFHAVSPRVIFISDGQISIQEDIPGMVSLQDAQTSSLQNLTLELMGQMIEQTLCRIYCVPVGNSNVVGKTLNESDLFPSLFFELFTYRASTLPLCMKIRNFLDMLASSTAGCLLHAAHAKRASRFHLHHLIVAALKTNRKSQGEPSREEVKQMFSKVSNRMETYEIDSVLSLWKEPEPDIEGQRRQHLARAAGNAQQSGLGRGNNDLAASLPMMGGRVPGSGSVDSLLGNLGMGGGIPGRGTTSGDGYPRGSFPEFGDTGGMFGRAEHGGSLPGVGTAMALPGFGIDGPRGRGTGIPSFGLPGTDSGGLIRTPFGQGMDSGALGRGGNDDPIDRILRQGRDGMGRQGGGDSSRGTTSGFSGLGSPLGGFPAGQSMDSFANLLAQQGGLGRSGLGVPASSRQNVSAFSGRDQQDAEFSAQTPRDSGSLDSILRRAT